MRRRRERYRLQRERETVEEREVRLARRREYYRRRRATITQNNVKLFYSREEQLQQTRHGYLHADEDATSCETSIPSAL